jgi:hypothetical protein
VTDFPRAGRCETNESFNEQSSDGIGEGSAFLCFSAYSTMVLSKLNILDILLLLDVGTLSRSMSSDDANIECLHQK